MTTKRTVQAQPTSTGASDSVLPDELLAAGHRLATSRARSVRALGRSRTRRRILPSIVVTSLAMIGAGMANSFVSSTVVPVASSTPTTMPAAVVNQNEANAAALARLSAVLAADRRTLAALAAAAARTSAAASSSTAASSQPAPVSSGSSPTAASVPAPVAAAPAPPVHATTGASGAG